MQVLELRSLPAQMLSDNGPSFFGDDNVWRKADQISDLGNMASSFRPLRQW